MTNFPGRSGYESGVDEPTRRALFDVDRRVTIIENGGGSTEYLNDLLDVNAPSPSGQQVLTYNDLNSEWEPTAPLAALGLAAFVYTFKTATDGTPAAGQIELNNADPALATEMYIHEIDSNGADIALFLENLLPGSWCNIGERDNYQAHHHSYDVVTPTTENGQVWTVPLTLYETVGGAFVNNEKLNLVLRYIAPGGGGGTSTATVQTFVDASGTFEKADYPGLAYVKVAVVGGGGGGGGAGACDPGEVSCGAGGGAGGVGYRTLLESELADVETIVVGAGGTGATVADPGNATNGQASTAFGITANGGNKGDGTVSVAYDFANAAPGAGGAVSGTYDRRHRGEKGAPPVVSPNRNTGGNGASSPVGRGGAGGNGVTATGSDGFNGENGGGGGGGINRAGTATDRAGGNGGDGRVYVWVYTVVPAAPAIGPWAAFTPVVNQGGVVAATDVRSRWFQVGNMVTFMFKLTVTGTGSTTGMYLTLPVTPATVADSVHGSGAIFDASTNTTYNGDWSGLANNIIGLTGDWSGGGLWGGTPSIALASGDSIRGVVTIEVAGA